jgi:hypothetical protein
MPIGCVSAKCCCGATVGICNCLVHEARLRAKAQQLAEDWHEGVPNDKQHAWACRAAGVLLAFAGSAPAAGSKDCPPCARPTSSPAENSVSGRCRPARIARKSAVGPMRALLSRWPPSGPITPTWLRKPKQ